MTAALAAATTAASGLASAQNGHMMGGGMGGVTGWAACGGCGLPVLLVVVVGLGAWIVMQRRK